MAGLNSWICSCIFTQLLVGRSAIEVVNLTPKSPVVVIENQPQTFTCSITVQQNWRSTSFYEKTSGSPVLSIVSSGSLCYFLPYNQSRYEGTCDRSKGIYTITIKSVSVAYDKTLIKCEAIYGTGNAGSDVKVEESVEISVQVAPPNGPKITQSPQGAINDSTTVVLTCEVTGGNPLANLSWQCQDSNIIQPTGSPPTNTVTSSVQLKANSLLNGRTCNCTAKHVLWLEPKTQNHTFVVNFAPSTEIILTQSPQGPVYEGTTIVLTCEVTGGNPLALLSWQCTESFVFQPTERPPSDKATSSVQLTVNNLFNGRTCTCTAKHLLWIVPKSQSHTLVVYFPPPNGPRITQSPQGAINDSSTVVMTCDVTSGNPLATLSWQCQDSFAIQPTKSPNTDTATSSVQLLANPLLNGRTCSCTATQLLWTEAKTQNHTFVVNFAPSNEIIITQSPQGPVYEGTTVVLTCEVIGGNPLALLSWQCTDSSVFQATQSLPSDKATSSLQLTVNSLFNGRTCTCTAKHLLWLVSKSRNYTFVAYFKPLYGPVITQSPQGAINDGSTVVLTCEVTDGNPLANLSWQCQDTSVIKPTGSPPTNRATASVQLIANRFLNGRTCICFAKHLLWNVPKTQIHTFAVYWQPVLNPDMISSQPDIQLTIGMTLNLTINVISNPVPEIQWFFEHNNVIENITAISNTSSSGYTYRSTVIIADIYSSQFGSYTVVISNSIGNFTKLFSVIPIEKPTAPAVVFVVCFRSSAIVLWRSEFNGGLQQTFEIKYWDFQSTYSRVSANIFDSGQNSELRHKIEDLKLDTNYLFVISAKNLVGNVMSKTVNCSTGTENSYSALTDQNGTVLFSIGISALIVSLLAATGSVILLCRIKRKRKLQKRCETYTKFNTRSPQSVDTYDDLHTRIAHGAQEGCKINKENNTYEECKPSLIKVKKHREKNVEMQRSSYKGQIIKNGVYENMKT